MRSNENEQLGEARTNVHASSLSVTRIERFSWGELFSSVSADRQNATPPLFPATWPATFRGAESVSEKQKISKLVTAVTKLVTSKLINNNVGAKHLTNPKRKHHLRSRKNLMLVLSRKAGEKIVIDGNVIVEVVKIQATESHPSHRRSRPCE